MKFFLAKLPFYLLILLVTNICVLGQTARLKQPKPQYVKLAKANPDSWFQLLLPKGLGIVKRFADVDGGFYIKNNFEVKWDYWTYEGTPNFLRDVNNNYSKRPLLSCPKTPVLRTKIDGNRAIIQNCFNKNARNGFRYTYYVTFPKIKVYDGQEMRYGVFNLSISYKNPNYLQTARQIVYSLKFKSQIIAKNQSYSNAFLK